MWSEGDSLPNRGWYGGNVKLMIGNGTYADFRPRIELSAKKGKFSTVGTPEERIEKSLKKLSLWDKEWEAIPLEERIKRRNLVADNAAIREVIVHTARGPFKTLRSTPENNDNLSKQEQFKERKLPQKLPTGSIRRDNAPPSLISTPQ